MGGWETYMLSGKLCLPFALTFGVELSFALGLDLCSIFDVAELYGVRE